MAQPAAVSRHKVGNRSNNWRGICRRFLCTLQKIGLGNFTERGHKTRTAAESSTVARFASASSSPARGATYSRNALKPKDSKGFHSPEIHREIHCGVEAAPKDKAEPDKDKRRSFTLDEAAAILARLVSHAKTDLQHIWRILKGLDVASPRSQVCGLQTCISNMPSRTARGAGKALKATEAVSGFRTPYPHQGRGVGGQLVEPQTNDTAKPSDTNTSPTSRPSAKSKPQRRP
ncbi:hypothetical protein Mesau_05584 [Mesorhizobium australicum WSM2073]|uniref:Uncharacterized protein n=1 Tax=Mesorhizobium australicum (strain HAMBI 3006 / LMG 24608 / WSM2073) TaxID=754035 RepID=L0KV97_MESAW|nr:hypothetical protein Mesau_05584 [Mesorhizobium australicum WSM2073]